MRGLWRIGILWVGLMLAACGTATPVPPTLAVLPSTTPPPSDTPTPEPTPTIGIVPFTTSNDPTEQSYLRVIHAAPSVSTVDVYLELLAVATNLDYTRSTDRTGIVAGNYSLRVVPTGESPDAEALLATSVALSGGQSYILLFTESDGVPVLSVLPEATAPLGQGESRVTAIHAIPRGPAFALAKNGDAITSQIEFGEISDSAVLPTGRTELTFQTATDTLLTYPIDLRERYSYTLVLLGSVDDLNNVSVIAFDTLVGGAASVRAINASSAGALDFYINGSPLAQNLAYPNASPRITPLADRYLVEVFAAGADPTTATPILSQQMRFNPDDSASLIAVGSAENLRLVDYFEDSSPTPPNEARLAFLNTLPNEPLVVPGFESSSIPGITESSFGDAPTSALIGIGDTYIFITQTPSGERVETAENVALAAGTSYLYLVTGGYNNPVILSEEVGVDESLAGLQNGVEPTLMPSTPTLVRFVNAIFPNTSVDLALDGTLRLSGQTYAETSEFFNVPAGDHTFELRQIGGQSPLTTMTVTLEEGTPYSIFAYLPNTGDYRLLVVPDSDVLFDNEAPRLRLINIAQGGISLGIAISPPEAVLPGLPTLVPGVNIIPDNPGNEMFPANRQTLPFGLEPIVRGIAGGEVSNAILMPAGLRSINVVDTQANLLALTLANVTLEAGKHYDLFAFQEIDSNIVRGFLLEYPSR